jgi:hypothetical protein
VGLVTRADSIARSKKMVQKMGGQKELYSALLTPMHFVPKVRPNNIKYRLVFDAKASGHNERLCDAPVVHPTVDSNSGSSRQ